MSLIFVKHVLVTSLYDILYTHNTAQKMTFSIKDLLSKCDQMHSFFYWRNP